ncbi:glycosyltransferase family 2 protein [Actinoplanes xinjiangensis]|uniref:GT2 family glycosyltransferase n=1 Tax=Actinoplanes xinjiangensis TaxID=512350 RepID=A0A316F9S3_9ACTN|nr:glycosyltransferase [Actinoplanes xinjiangensis]PWK42572.1 GT2 family glycosyltransferase [Actinoplanes xinjiangensis]GIF38133.1 glycosyl transferase [Actinoplanes xinjiangensis]
MTVSPTTGRPSRAAPHPTGAEAGSPALLTAAGGAPESERVTVVVATRDRRERLFETMPEHRAPVILVDNASTDGSPDAISEAFPAVEVVRLGENRGAAARNEGVHRARTPYVAFADDDSYWTEGSLARAAALFDANPRLGLLTAQVLIGPDARPDPISAAQAAAPLGTPPGAPGPPVLGFLSCAVVVRREAFLQAGGFEPRLFVYGEEALLAMDMTAAGWWLCYCPDLVVRHFPLPAGRDTGARHRIESRNRLLTALLRRPPAVVARTVAATLRESPPAVWDVARALPWALRHRRPLPPSTEAALTRLDT